MDISIVCVTGMGKRAEPFLNNFRELADKLNGELLLGADISKTQETLEVATRYAHRVIPVTCNGSKGIVWNSVAEQAQGYWVLMMDDDEEVSPAMEKWLLQYEWRDYPYSSSVYSFPCAHLWGDREHFISTSPLYPDCHARLMHKELHTQWGTTIHASNPQGLGKIVPALFLHHKFILKSFEERKQIAETYDQLENGSGTGNSYRPFGLPETHFDEVTIQPVGDGSVPENVKDLMNRGEPCRIRRTE